VNYLCAGYLAFFRHIDEPMRRMADLLRKGRSSAEIMDWAASHAWRPWSRRREATGRA